MIISIIGVSISGFDFDPLGTSVATIDAHCMCLISDIDSNSERYHIKLVTKYGNLFVYPRKNLNKLEDAYNRCLWSTNPSEQLLYIRYMGSNLNILDVQKGKFTLNEPIRIDEGDYFNNLAAFSSCFAVISGCNLLD